MQKKFTARRSPLARAITTLGLALVIQSALAQNLSFDIPAQPLPAALSAFARQTGLQLAFPPELVQGKQGRAVAGARDVRSALHELLTGTGLQGEVQGKTLVIAPASAQRSVALSEVTVKAHAERSATSEGTGSYAARGASMFKGELALKDIPQSISVVTRQRMDEQNMGSVYEALAGTTGITIQQSPQGGKYILSRGFELGTVQYDGVPLNRDIYGRASNYSSAMAYIDRVEVLRGAAGLLQGEGSPAGAVNLVRKRPLHENAMSVQASAGTWDRYGTQLDVSRVLNEEGTLRGRALIDYEDQHSFVDHVNRRSATLYGTLEYDLSPATRINLGFSSEDAKGRPTMNGLPRLNTGADLNLARSTYLGALWNRQESSNRSLYFDVAHQFNADWKLKLTGVHIKEDHDLKYASANRAVVPALMQSANTASRSLVDIETSGMDAHLTGAFAAFGRRHEIVTGANYAKATNDTTFGYKLNYNIFNVASYDANIREPEDSEIYGANREDGIGKREQYGIYSALRWQLTDPLKLVVGARASWFRMGWDTYTGSATPSVQRTRESAKVNPYAGLIYEISPEWSAYASYADIFQPQSQQNQAGAMLKPILGANYEAGIKGELMDGKVNTALALFRIDQKHRAQVDYGTGPTCRNNYYCYTDTGEVRSQGLDAEVSGEIARNWNLFAGYTFTRTKYLKDVSSQGMVFNTYTPKHLFRLWTTYRLPGAMNAITLGGGVDAQSASYRQIGNVHAEMNGRAVWNAVAKYQINRNWSAALNVNNVFDKRYYSSVAALVNGNYYGDPRNFMLTLRGAF